MLTTDKILTHKVHGKNLILLTQVESSYFFVVAQIVKTKSLFSKKTAKNAGGTLKTIFKEQVSEAEALAIFNELTGAHQPSETSSALLLPTSTQIANTSSQEIILLLEGTVQKSEAKAPAEKPRTVVSPYFPTKDIFLSVQKTRAPAKI